MKKIIFLFALAVLVSCGKQTRLEKLINETDIIKVYIYGSGTVPIVHYETNNIDKIKEWKDYISSKDAKPGDCKLANKLIFKVYEDSTVMNFSLAPGCRYVHFETKDSVFNKELTDKGVVFLTELMKAQ